MVVLGHSITNRTSLRRDISSDRRIASILGKVEPQADRDNGSVGGSVVFGMDALGDKLWPTEFLALSSRRLYHML